MSEESHLLAVLGGIVLVIGFWFTCSIADHQPADPGRQSACVSAIQQGC